jgi:tRNA (guanine-N7-)-methyltransferase
LNSSNINKKNILTHTLSVTALPWPTDWHMIFGREAELWIEVGFGDSSFLVELAQNNLDKNILGLEISLPSLRKGERKVERSGLTNVRFIQARAQAVLWALCAENSVNALIINFPDPWPKPAHHQRRLINDRFLQLVAPRMPAGGVIDLATDHSEYAGWISSCLERSPYFNSRLDSQYVTQDDDRLRTKYEEKALAGGQTCFYFKWQRNCRKAPDVFSIPQELPMPHVLIQTPQNQEQISQRFQPTVFTSESASVRFIDLYQSVGQDSLLVDTYISEEPIEQRVLLAITWRETGDCLLHLHEVGFPRPTPGIHYALQCLTHWVCGLHKEAFIIRQNLQQEER